MLNYSVNLIFNGFQIRIKIQKNVKILLKIIMKNREILFRNQEKSYGILGRGICGNPDRICEETFFSLASHSQKTTSS